jgi:hypothetical protein
MWKRLNSGLESLSSHWSLLLLIAGSSLTATITGYAAMVTVWLAAWGAIAWVGAGLLGAGIFILLIMGFAYARRNIVHASIEKQFFSRPDAINPLGEEFRNKRIKISDLVSPIDSIVRGKRFRNCEIIGPANIVLFSSSPGSGALTHCEMSSVCAVLVRDGVQMMNGVIFEDCRIENCRLHQITFYFPESSYTWANEVLPGMLWITPAPASLQSV